MDAIQIYSWKKARSKGVLRYIVTRGISLGVICTFLPYLLFRKKIILSKLPIWFELGAEILMFSFFCLVDWLINEFRYKRSIMEDKNTLDGTNI